MRWSERNLRTIENDVVKANKVVHTIVTNVTAIIVLFFSGEKTSLHVKCVYL